jgi:hypothetical protein
MEELESNSKAIDKLCWFFIIAGLIEIFVLIFIFHSFFAIIPGLITIFSANSALNKTDKKRGYFVGIWPLIKYNPISLALVSFIMTDFLSGSLNSNSTFLSIIIFLFLTVAVLSVVFGVIIIVKISKYNKLIKYQMKEE